MLWMGGKLREHDVLENLDRNSLLSELPPPNQLKPTPNQLKIAIGRLPGVQALRRRIHRQRINHEFAELGRTGGNIVYHETNMIPNRFHGTTVVHMHDLSWWHHPELHPQERITWIERNLSRMLRQTARFVCVSEFTATALSKDLGVSKSNIDVVPSAASPIFRPYSCRADGDVVESALRRYDLQDRSYIFSVSTLEPRKNFDRLLAAHLALPSAVRKQFPLIIAGGSGWGKRLANESSRRAQNDGSL